MLTQCPHCQTVFRVTSTILRAAHGQVRCGRCNTQFDAIENLLEGDTPVADSASSNANSTQANTETELTAPQFVAEPISHEDIVLEGNRIEISGVYRRPAVHLEDEDEAHTHTIIEAFNDDDDENVEEIDDGAAVTEADDAETELEDIEQELNAAEIADAMASLETERDNEVASAPPIHTDRSLISGAHAALAVANAADNSLNTVSIDDELFGRKPNVRRWPWVAASAGLILLLMAQTVHHARAALARHPSIGPQITRLYTAIGQPLEPQWQLQAYSIKQWGIVSDPQAPGTLRVRASVTNGATFAQPYPLLQLALEDRFGGNVGKRVFKPEEYLSSAALATRMLNAGEAANIDLAIVDPGPEAVGFQFDTCLQIANAPLRCTHELPPGQ